MKPCERCKKEPPSAEGAAGVAGRRLGCKVCKRKVCYYCRVSRRGFTRCMDCAKTERAR